MIELDWVISNRGVAQGTVMGMISDDVHQLFLIGEKKTTKFYSLQMTQFVYLNPGQLGNF